MKSQRLNRDTTDAHVKWRATRCFCQRFLLERTRQTEIGDFEHARQRRRSTGLKRRRRRGSRQRLARGRIFGQQQIRGFQIPVTQIFGKQVLQRAGQLPKVGARVGFEERPSTAALEKLREIARVTVLDSARGKKKVKEKRTKNKFRKQASPKKNGQSRPPHEQGEAEKSSPSLKESAHEIRVLGRLFAIDETQNIGMLQSSHNADLRGQVAVARVARTPGLFVRDGLDRRRRATVVLSIVHGGECARAKLLSGRVFAKTMTLLLLRVRRRSGGGRSPGTRGRRAHVSAAESSFWVEKK